MATLRTLEQLREAVRGATDSRGSSALDRHPDSEITDAINRGRAAFFVLVSQCNGGERTITSTTINTVAGTTTYALPTDLERVVSVDMTIAGQSYWLQPFQHEERGQLAASAVYLSGAYPTSYKITGDSLELQPPPSGVYAVFVRYVPTPPLLTTSTSSFDTIARLGEEYVTYWAARIICESDRAWDVADRYSARLGELEVKIQTQVRMRGDGPMRIADVSSRAVRRW